MQCKTADDLIALAGIEGYEISKEEAEAYMAELADVDIYNNTEIQFIAGNDSTAVELPRLFCYNKERQSAIDKDRLTVKVSL